jgi:hypothetical protein
MAIAFYLTIDPDLIRSLLALAPVVITFVIIRRRDAS